MRRLAVVLALTVIAGCGRSDPDGRQGAVEAVLATPGNLLVGTPDTAKAAAARTNRLQIEINDLADLYAAQVAEGCDRAYRVAPTAEDRMAVHRWRMSNAVNAWNAASTSETPDRGLMDLMTLSALARAVAESSSQRFKDLPEARRLYEIHCTNETRIWEHAKGYLRPENLTELRAAIDRTVAANPRDYALLSLRLNDLFPELGAAGEIKRTGGLVGLLSLDPFSGLDPTTRAINETRRSAERMLYRVERMQTTLRWNIEHVVDKLAGSEDGARLLADVHRLSQVGDRVAAVAEALPDRLGAERAAIVAAVEANQGRLAELAAQVRGALDSGTGMAEALDRLLRTFTALVGRFEKPVAAAGAPAPAASAAPSRPFDIDDYRRTAEEIGRTADNLDRLVHSASQAADSPAIDRHLAKVEDAVARLERAGDALVLKAAGLLAGLILLAGVVALGVRRLGR